MDLEMEIIKAFWLKSIEGHRKLAENEIRFSHSPECSHALFYDKIYPEADPDPNVPIFVKDPGTGIIKVKNAKAVVGTWTHDGIESHLKTIARCEDETKYMNDKVFMSGKIDIHYYQDTDKIGDIKTTSTYVFPAMVGQREAKDNSYSQAKREISIIQANHYAYVENCPVFSIVWVDRNDGPFKVESFITDSGLFKAVVGKIESVIKCVQIFKETGKITLPPFDGIPLCDLGGGGKVKKIDCYCRHRFGGTTDQDFHEESPAHCPGSIAIRMREKLEAQHATLPQFATKDNIKPQLPKFEDIVDKYTEERDGIWYCRECGKPISEVTDFQRGKFTSHHLWFDHKIRTFRTENLPGLKFE